MPVTIACIAGEEIYRQWDSGRIDGEKLGRRNTPFGESGDIFLTRHAGSEFYLLPRYGCGLNKTAPRKINSRANMYALKDMGVQHIIAWGPGGVITHNIAVGDLIILDDVVDQTYLRDKTFFENSPLGFLRQFPVFCPTIRRAACEALHEMKVIHHESGTAAVREGPRLETPAEVRLLTAVGAQVVTHTFVPEVFLARELQLCYGAICYAVNYAETGSKHRTFATGELFGGLTQQSDRDRLSGVVGAMGQIVQKIAEKLPKTLKNCDCDHTMTANIRQYNLPQDWRKWFDLSG